MMQGKYPGCAQASSRKGSGMLGWADFGSEYWRPVGNGQSVRVGIVLVVGGGLDGCGGRLGFQLVHGQGVFQRGVPV